MSEELIIPTGELVELEDPQQVARALETLRSFEQQIREAKAELTFVLVEYSRHLGSRTITFENGQRAIIKGGSETHYDAEAIMEGLRQMGMSEARLSEIVQETVSYKVNAVEAKRAANANPDYAAVIDEHSRQVERRHSVELR